MITFKLLKPREKEEETAVCSVMVPRLCPLVLLFKVGWKGGKTFGNEEGRDKRWSKEGS
jgi:hypothetical protein